MTITVHFAIMREMRLAVLYIKETVVYLRSRMTVLNPFKNNRGLPELFKDLKFWDVRFLAGLSTKERYSR